jgi:wobble nucleotide-excising tRNase
MFDSSITIKGGAFTKPTKLENILEKRMSIVYGRNGSGKSTIARAFREQQPDYQQKHPGRSFCLSFDEKSDSLPADVQERLFVFNEDFIDDNVKFSGGGLKSIVRIGSSAELEGPIEETKNRIKELTKELEPLQKESAELAGKGDKSINAADKKLREGLKDRFIVRLNKIEGRDHNISGTLVTAIRSTLVDESRNIPILEEEKALNEEIDRYLSLQEGNLLAWHTPDLSGLPNLDSINNLLAQAIRPAEMSDQERAILDDLSNSLAAENFIAKTETLIVKNDRDYCPLCHQPVSAEHKHMLEQRIVRFRDRQVEDFKEKIREALEIITLIPDTIPDIPAINKEILEKGHQSLSRLNAFITIVRESVEKKLANPFSAMPLIDKDEWETIVSSSRDAFNKIAEETSAYNQKLQEKAKLLSDIKQRNIALAARENRSWIEELKRRNDRKEAVDAEIAALQARIRTQEDKLKSLQGQLDQIDDAREQINYYLGIIFGDRKLRLANASKDSYKLQLKTDEGYRDIPTRSISSGERNALALAYFFACVLEKKDKGYDYGEPTLLVIDDPVSSFDTENKAGVLSLVSTQCRKILNGHADSKILIFTHDQTSLRTLCEHRFQFFSGDKEQTENYLLLSQGHKLKTRKCANIHGNMEYYSDLMAIFNFAQADDPEEFEDFDTIGNTIRSFAECFASQMYKCSWPELFTNPRRLKCLPIGLPEKLQAFAIRSVLNSESHSVFSDFEPAEIQRTAKMLLVFIYYSNHDHLQAYLVRKDEEDENNWKMNLVKGWGQEF